MHVDLAGWRKLCQAWRHSSGDSKRKYISEEGFEDKHEVTSTETGQNPKVASVCFSNASSAVCSGVHTVEHLHTADFMQKADSAQSFFKPKTKRYAAELMNILTGEDIFILSLWLYLAVLKSKLYLHSQGTVYYRYFLSNKVKNPSIIYLYCLLSIKGGWETGANRSWLWKSYVIASCL